MARVITGRELSKDFLENVPFLNEALQQILKDYQTTGAFVKN